MADAKHLRIVVSESEAEEVCRESSQIEPRIGLPTHFKAIKIKTTVHSVVNAVPTECAVDRRQGSRPPGGSALLKPLNAGVEVIHKIRSPGQHLKVCHSARDHRLESRSEGISLHHGERDLAPVQSRQRLPDPF